MSKEKKLAEGWIRWKPKTMGSYPWECWPKELNYHDDVELIFHDGTIITGMAGEYCWTKEEGSKADRVKWYRKVAK